MKRYSILLLATCLLLQATGCNQKNSTDSSGESSISLADTTSSSDTSPDIGATQDEGAAHPIYQSIMGSEGDSLYLATDKTVATGYLVPSTPELARDVADTLGTALLRETPAEITLEDPTGFESSLEISAYKEPVAQVTLYKFGADHPAYPGKALGTMTLGDEDPVVISLDPVTYDILYNLLDVASYSPEAPVEEFILPLQQIINDYQEGRIESGQRQWFEPLPEGAALPEVKSSADFTVQESQGTFPYVAVMPMSGGIEMQASLIYYDETGWGVGSVKFVDIAPN